MAFIMFSVSSVFPQTFLPGLRGVGYNPGAHESPFVKFQTSVPSGLSCFQIFRRSFFATAWLNLALES